MKTLKNRLKEKIDNCYLLEGEDYYLYDKAFSMIKKACKIDLEDFNLSIFDDENFSMQNVLNACEVMPMGSEFKIVVLKNVSKISENDKKMLQKYIENPTLSTILIIFDYFNVFSFIKDKCAFVDCKRFDNETAKAVIVSEFSKRNKQISGEAVNTLLDYCNGYLTRVNNEIDKLCYYDLSEPLVTKKMVDNLVCKDDEFIIYELTEALGQKKSDKAVKILDSLVKEQGILGLISNHFRRLFFISISGLDNKELSKLLGVKEYAISKQRNQVNNFSKMQLKKIYELLEEVDFNIKSGAMLQEFAIYYLVLSILYI